MAKQCVLIQHGLSLSHNKIGTCCYNQTNPNVYTSYDIDPINCRACIDQEMNNIFSYRQGVNQKYNFQQDNKKIFVLDVTPNKNCNLTCKICDELSSSAWAKLKQIPINKNYNQSVSLFEKTLTQYDLSALEEINFSGGEPFLNNNIQRYLDTLAPYTDFSKVTLRFSNNGSIKISNKLIEFFQQFKLVQARFSLDDVASGHEYQRHPSKWLDWENNWIYFLENMPHNVMPAINRTVSMLNINRLHLLSEWKSQYKFTKYNDPIELIDHFAFGPYELSITDRVKEYILNTFGNESLAWKYIQHRKLTTNYLALQNIITEHDKLQGTSFETFNKEMYNLIFV